MKPFSFGTKVPILLLALFFLLQLFGCAFPSGYKNLKKPDYPRAKQKFEKARNHATYGPGADYYLLRMEVGQMDSLNQLLSAIGQYCEIADEVQALSFKQQLKLRRYDVSVGNINKATEQLRQRIFKDMASRGTVTQLRTLEENVVCWPEPSLDSLRRIITNGSIDPTVEIYPDMPPWRGQPATHPTQLQGLLEPGWSYQVIFESFDAPIGYEDLLLIEEHYLDYILPANRNSYRQIRENAWDIFQEYHRYCDMPEFKTDFPNNRYAADCWFEAASDTLCLGQLKPLLAFHRNNAHTSLDLEISLQLAALAYTELAKVGQEKLPLATLTAAENTQLADVIRMLELSEMAACSTFDKSMEEVIDEVRELASKYSYHRTPYLMAQDILEPLIERGEVETVVQAAKAWLPVYPDSLVCPDIVMFQFSKERYFRHLLRQAENGKIIPLEAMAVWNTEEHHEHSLVSWGDNQEVFFVRVDGATGQEYIMTSVQKRGIWTPPKRVPSLPSGSGLRLLSISTEGRQLLFKQGHKLYQATRLKVGRRWSSPTALEMSSAFAGDAWLSPNDSVLLTTVHLKEASLTAPSQISIAGSRLMGEVYGRPMAVSNSLIEDDYLVEQRPIMGLGGRMLYFTSERNDSPGKYDIYTISYDKAWQWSTASKKPVNLGVSINTSNDDEGLTHLSDYDGYVYLHRTNRCSGTLDIYRAEFPTEGIPDNLLRLAGLLLDENGNPIQSNGHGFVEVTANYQLNVHSEPVTENGLYVYTVPEATEVVRVFPEVPGYYSEREAVHSLDEVTPGEIVRDTFHLLSFEHIRQNFELEYSTFFNGTATFDDPNRAYPELTRLAKIAVRMGAIVHLTGHTDNTGTENENKQLSLDRATSVRNFLVEKCGFPPERVKVFGYGASRPDCDNSTEEGRRCNRRVKVEFHMPELR